MLPPGKRRSVRTLGPAGVGSSAGARYNQPGTGACTAGERQPGGGRSVGTGGHPSVLLLTPLRVSMLPCKCAEDRPPWSAGGSREPSASPRASRAEAARAGARRRRGWGSIGCFNTEGPGQPLERRRREQSGAGQKGDGGAPSGVSPWRGPAPSRKARACGGQRGGLGSGTGSSGPHRSPACRAYSPAAARSGKRRAPKERDHRRQHWKQVAHRGPAIRLLTSIGGDIRVAHLQKLFKLHVVLFCIPRSQHVEQHFVREVLPHFLQCFLR